MSIDVLDSVEMLRTLPAEKQSAALEFIRFVAQGSPSDRASRKRSRQKLAGTLPDSECQAMLQAIEESFEQIEDSMWT